MSEFNKTLTEVFHILKDIQEGKKQTDEIGPVKHYLIEHLKGIEKEFKIEEEVDGLLNQYQVHLKNALKLINEGHNIEACKEVTKAYSLVLEIEFELKKAYGDTHKYLQ